MVRKRVNLRRAGVQGRRVSKGRGQTLEGGCRAGELVEEGDGLTNPTFAWGTG